MLNSAILEARRTSSSGSLLASRFNSGTASNPSRPSFPISAAAVSLTTGEASFSSLRSVAIVGELGVVGVTRWKISCLTTRWSAVGLFLFSIMLWRKKSAAPMQRQSITNQIDGRISRIPNRSFSRLTLTSKKEKRFCL